MDSSIHQRGVKRLYGGEYGCMMIGAVCFKPSWESFAAKR